MFFPNLLGGPKEPLVLVRGWQASYLMLPCRVRIGPVFLGSLSAIQTSL